MRYQVVAEAYRDLEQASGRLMLIDRLAALLAQTPQELLPTVCYMCQGLVAPEFAAVDLGLAEKLALRAVATATGVEPGEVVAAVREAGDLGQAAEQLLATTAGDREPSLQVVTVVDTLHEIARAEGSGSQGRKLDLLAGPSGAGHSVRGSLPAAFGDRQPAAGDRYAHDSGRAGAGVHRQPEGPAGTGARIQHLLRSRPGRGHAGLRRAGRSAGAAGAGRQSGAGDAGAAVVRRRRDSRQAGRAVHGGVQIRRHAAAGTPHR